MAHALVSVYASRVRSSLNTVSSTKFGGLVPHLWVCFAPVRSYLIALELPVTQRSLNLPSASRLQALKVVLICPNTQAATYRSPGFFFLTSCICHPYRQQALLWSCAQSLSLSCARFVHVHALFVLRLCSLICGAALGIKPFIPRTCQVFIFVQSRSF